MNGVEYAPSFLVQAALDRRWGQPDKNSHNQRAGRPKRKARNKIAKKSRKANR